MNNKIEWKKSSIDYDKLNQITHKSLVSSQEKSSEWKEKISKSNKGKVVSNESKEKIKESLKILRNKLSKEERKLIYANNAMLGKTHSEETKNKIREKAIGRIISDKQKKDISKKLSVPIIATNLSTGIKTEYSSQKEASKTLGLTGILHVLKGRSKQCGGYYFEYKDVI